MFSHLGQTVVRLRRPILWTTLAFVVVAGVAGAGVFGVLKGGGFDDPASESARAAGVLNAQFGQGDPNLVLLVTAVDGNVDSPASSTAALAVIARLDRLDHVTTAGSYWQLASPPSLRSEQGDKALVLARLKGDGTQIGLALEEVEQLSGVQGAVAVQIGGAEAVQVEVGETVEGDLARAEAIAIPVTLVLLIVIFGSVVAALLPLVVGGIAIVGTFLALYVLGSITDVSIFSINLATALGLGLAVDYSLFIVSRYREELSAGLTPHEAVVRSVETAGRTVAFSALTVAVSLSALLVFPLYFLRSFAYAGIAVVLIAMLAAIVSLPALLAVLGLRVDAWNLGRRRVRPASSGMWHGIAMRVMRHPVSIGTLATVVLIALALPFAGAQFGSPDDRVLPSDADSRIVSDVLREEFATNESGAFGVAIPQPVAAEALAAYATRLSAVEGVARVDGRDGIYVSGRAVAPADQTSERFISDSGTWLNVVSDVEPVSPEGERLAEEIRDLDAPFDTLVAGASAELVDTKAAIFDRLPLVGVIVGGATFVLLFLMFGSLLVPAKALLLNLLSLTATFGAMVWVFQDGNGAGLLDFTPTGTLDTSMPILMFCVAFGLSMDYEVFLLSRIKEEHDRTGDNTQAVAAGLERTGRIVTAAALLLAVTFISFSTSGVTFIKLFGLGLTLAVLMDATIVRALLVPAFMRLAGEANWWAPAPLRRLHQRVGFSESESVSSLSRVSESRAD